MTETDRCMSESWRGDSSVFNLFYVIELRNKLATAQECMFLLFNFVQYFHLLKVIIYLHINPTQFFPVIRPSVGFTQAF